MKAFSEKQLKSGAAFSWGRFYDLREDSWTWVMTRRDGWDQHSIRATLPSNEPRDNIAWAIRGKRRVLSEFMRKRAK